MSKFDITAQQGFHITFENGWTVSVQFGRANYCANRNISSMAVVPASPNAEIAAWDANGKWFEDKDGNTVQGHMKADEVLAFMNKIAAIEKTGKAA